MKDTPIKSPTYLVPHYMDIPQQELWDQGIRAFLFDLERTLEPVGCEVISPRTAEWLTGVRRRGFEVALCTNTTRQLGPEITHHFKGKVAQPTPDGTVRKKPDPTIFNLGFELLGFPAKQVCMVGDKLLYDTSPAIAAGAGATVLVNPLPGHDVIWEYFAFRRTRERLALLRLGISRP